MIPLVGLGVGFVGNVVYNTLPLPFSMRVSSAKLRKHLRYVEGLSSKKEFEYSPVPLKDIETYNGKIYAYRDHLGYNTIGFGHLMLQGDSTVIDAQTAWRLFDFDLSQKEKDVKNLFKNVLVTQGQYDVILSLAFNGGVFMFNGTNFLNFVKSGQMEKARMQLDFWANDSSGLGLTKRRMVEHIIWLGKTFKGLHPSEISTQDAQAFRSTKSKEILQKYVT